MWDIRSRGAAGIDRMLVAKGLSMQKWLCWASIGVGGVMLLLFILDLAIGIPFEGGFQYKGDYASDMTVVDFVGILTACIILYLGWSAFRELR